MKCSPRLHFLLFESASLVLQNNIEMSKKTLDQGSSYALHNISSSYAYQELGTTDSCTLGSIGSIQLVRCMKDRNSKREVPLDESC